MNNREIKTETFTLYKGINKIVVIDNNSTIQGLNLTYLNTLIGNENIYINCITKPILTDSEGNKYISLSVPEFSSSFDKVGTIYFPGLKTKLKVNTIKVKAQLKSLDKKTVPFISRLLVRGI